VHHGVLAAIPDEQRELFVDALTRLTDGYLRVPAEHAPQVRRERQRRYSA